MADPFSVASGAIGIISLGIEVSGRIVSYCQAWQDYGDDIQRFGAKADSVRTLLKRVRELLEEIRITNPEIGGDMERTVADLQMKVEQLHETLQRYRPALDSGPKRLRTQLKKAAHPFRKDTLNKMWHDLDDMEQSLQIALNLYTAKNVAASIKYRQIQEETLRMVQEIYFSTSQASTTRAPSLGSSCSCCEAQSTLNLERRHRPKDRTQSNVKSYSYYSRLFGVTASFTLFTLAGTRRFALSPMLSFQAICGVDSWQYRTMDYLYYRLFVPIPNTMTLIDDLIHELQLAFSEGKARPDNLFWQPFHIVSFIDAISMMPLYNWESQTTVLLKWAKFLGSIGSVPDNNSEKGLLATLCHHLVWTDDHYFLATYLVQIGGPLSVTPWSLRGKFNVRLMLSKNEDAISYPDIIKIIIRESRSDLIHALCSGAVQPQDTVKRLTLLDFAIGWPQGVQVLLDHGADPQSVSWELLFDNSPHSIELLDSDEVYESVCIIINAGHRINIGRFFPCLLSWQRYERLFIQSLSNRRKQLWASAEQELPLIKIAELKVDEHTIIDAEVARLHRSLEGHGRTVDLRLQEPSDWVPYQSIYHGLPNFPISVLDHLWAAGFRDIDTIDSAGFTPSVSLHAMTKDIWIVEQMAWLISKGVDYSRKVPGSNATVAHFWGAQMGARIFEIFRSRPSSQLYECRIFKDKMSKYGEHALLPCNQDCCLCPCSPNGCTTLSVALRRFHIDVSSQYRGYELLVESYPLFSNCITSPSCHELHISRQTLIRKILEIFIQFSKMIPKAEVIIIRCLGFQALRLKHACCIEINSLFWFNEDLKGKDDDEIEEILDEQKWGYQALEILMQEFQSQFDTLELPLWEFLTTHWQPRMIEYLSQRDSYNQKHHEETRKLGVLLEPAGNDIPDWLYYFGNKVEEL